MEKVEVKVTWQLVWSLWWRMMLLSIGVWAVFYFIMVVLFSVAVLTF